MQPCHLAMLRSASFLVSFLFDPEIVANATQDLQATVQTQQYQKVGDSLVQIAKQSAVPSKRVNQNASGAPPIKKPRKQPSKGKTSQAKGGNNSANFQQFAQPQKQHQTQGGGGKGSHKGKSFRGKGRGKQSS